MEKVGMGLEQFIAKVKADGYKNATAARRGLGKASACSVADRNKAAVFINTHFGDAADKPAKKAAKPAAKVAPVAKPATKSGRKPTTASFKSTPPDWMRPLAPSFALPVRVATIGGQEPVSTARVTAYGGIVQAYKNVQPLTDTEQLLYEIATSECIVNESPESKSRRLGTKTEGHITPTRPSTPKAPARPRTNGVSHQAALEVPAPTPVATRLHIAVPPPAVVAPPSPPPAVEPADINEENLTSEQRDQLKRIRQAAAGIPTNLATSLPGGG